MTYAQMRYTNPYRSPVRKLPEPRKWTDREARRLYDHIVNVAVLIDLFVTPVSPSWSPHGWPEGVSEHPYRWPSPHRGDDCQTYLARNLGFIKAMALRVKFPEADWGRSLENAA